MLHTKCHVSFSKNMTAFETAQKCYVSDFSEHLNIGEPRAQLISNGGFIILYVT